jgi:molybdenum cofactor cytidylyltransferase
VKVAVVAANPSIAAIVLAGGVSQRMGEANKLHLDIDGVSMLRRSLETLLGANLDEIVVVLGHEHQLTAKLIEDMDISTVYNTDYQSGQMTSVHCGLAALQRPSSGIMVALGDQPALTITDINLLIKAYANRGSAEVVIPMYQGNRGNPIIMSDQSRQDILAGKRNLGCRRFIENNPELVQMIEMESPAVIIDLDTPQEYQNYCKDHQSGTPNPSVN